MDASLLAWARRVKRGAKRGGCGGARLWLFTDAARLPDPLAAIALLPRGLGGVVLRPEGMTPATLRAAARLCRARRLALSVAGDWRLAARLRAGLHLRGGHLPAAAPRRLARLTGSAHDAAELVRCGRAGVGLVFISPVFPTASHPGAPALGARRWAALARLAPGRAAALGGVGASGLRALPRSCRAVGAIGAIRGALRVGHSVSQLPCRGFREGCENVTGPAIVLVRSGCS